MHTHTRAGMLKYLFGRTKSFNLSLFLLLGYCFGLCGLVHQNDLNQGDFCCYFHMKIILHHDSLYTYSHIPTGSSQPRDRIWVSCIAGRFFTNWAIREATHQNLEGVLYSHLLIHHYHHQQSRGCKIDMLWSSWVVREMNSKPSDYSWDPKVIAPTEQ